MRFCVEATDGRWSASGTEDFDLSRRRRGRGEEGQRDVGPQAVREGRRRRLGRRHRRRGQEKEMA